MLLLTTKLQKKQSKWCYKEDKKESHNQNITLINSVHREKNPPKKMILGEEVTHVMSKFQKEQAVTFSVTKIDNIGDKSFNTQMKEVFLKSHQ